MAATGPVSYEPQPQHGVQAAPLPVMTAGGQVSSTVPHGFATTATPQEGARMLPAPFPSLEPMGPPASTIPLKLAGERVPAFANSNTAATDESGILEARPTVTAGAESATTAEGRAPAKKDTGARPKVKRQEVPAAKNETTAGTTAVQTTTAGRQPTTSTSREERPRLTARRRRSTTPLVDETSYDEVSEEEFARKKNDGKEETPTEEVTLE